jgi:hypothetical protein
VTSPLARNKRRSMTWTHEKEKRSISTRRRGNSDTLLVFPLAPFRERTNKTRSFGPGAKTHSARASRPEGPSCCWFLEREAALASTVTVRLRLVLLASSRLPSSEPPPRPFPLQKLQSANTTREQPSCLAESIQVAQQD